MIISCNQSNLFLRGLFEVFLYIRCWGILGHRTLLRVGGGGAKLTLEGTFKDTLGQWGIKKKSSYMKISMSHTNNLLVSLQYGTKLTNARLHLSSNHFLISILSCYKDTFYMFEGHFCPCCPRYSLSRRGCSSATQWLRHPRSGVPHRLSVNSEARIV